MGTFENQEYLRQLYGSCDYTQIWLNEENINGILPQC